MQLSPEYLARRCREDARDSLRLALAVRNERALALLIDTAIESLAKEQSATREAQRQHGSARP